MSIGITIQLTLDGTIYYDSKCKWCGKPFNKHYKTEKYCCDTCRRYALQEQKATYQRKRRKQINHGHLISNETRHVGTNYLSQHRRHDFQDEYNSVQKEMRRLKLRT